MNDCRVFIGDASMRTWGTVFLFLHITPRTITHGDFLLGLMIRNTWISTSLDPIMICTRKTTGYGLLQWLGYVQRLQQHKKQSSKKKAKSKYA